MLGFVDPRFLLILSTALQIALCLFGVVVVIVLNGISPQLQFGVRVKSGGL